MPPVWGVSSGGSVSSRSIAAMQHDREASDYKSASQVTFPTPALPPALPRGSFSAIGPQCPMPQKRLVALSGNAFVRYGTTPPDVSSVRKVFANTRGAANQFVVEVAHYAYLKLNDFGALFGPLPQVASDSRA